MDSLPEGVGFGANHNSPHPEAVHGALQLGADPVLLSHGAVSDHALGQSLGWCSLLTMRKIGDSIG